MSPWSAVPVMSRARPIPPPATPRARPMLSPILRRMSATSGMGTGGVGGAGASYPGRCDFTSRFPRDTKMPIMLGNMSRTYSAVPTGAYTNRSSARSSGGFSSGTAASLRCRAHVGPRGAPGAGRRVLRGLDQHHRGLRLADHVPHAARHRVLARRRQREQHHRAGVRVDQRRVRLPPGAPGSAAAGDGPRRRLASSAGSPVRCSSSRCRARCSTTWCRC